MNQHQLILLIVCYLINVMFWYRIDVENFSDWNAIQKILHSIFMGLITILIMPVFLSFVTANYFNRFIWPTEKNKNNENISNEPINLDRPIQTATKDEIRPTRIQDKIFLISIVIFSIPEYGLLIYLFKYLGKTGDA